METIPRYNHKIKKRLEITGVIFSLIIVGFMIFSLLNYNQLKNGLAAEVEIWGLFGLFFVTFFLEFIPQLLNPLLGVMAAITVHMNIYSVIFVAVLSSFFGSCFGFWIGKEYGFKYVYAFFEEKQIVKIHKFWDKYGKWFVLISAISPLPYVPLIFGALHMTWKDFIVYGIIPRFLNFIVPGYLIYYGLWGF